MKKHKEGLCKEAVLHIMDSNFAFPLDLDTMTIRLRVKANNVNKCILKYGDRCAIEDIPRVECIEMRCICTDQLFDYYEVVFRTKHKRLFYYFVLEDRNQEVYYYYQDQFHDEEYANRSLYYQYGYIREKDIVKLPGWVEDAIVYQIFPDSFASSERALNGVGKSIPLDCSVSSDSRLGGTLLGIIDNIDYLLKLGINCIYINPLFTGMSYHKYDTVDYYTIDPCFGSNHDFREMVRACHEKGIRVILDGVFNHTSPYFFAFKDIIEKGQNSKYYDWYFIQETPINLSYPPNYEAFAYVPEMPRVNTGNEDVVKYFLNVGRYWIETFDIDGWRLDVANEIYHEFLSRFRMEMKKMNKEAVVIGEIWEDAPSFLQGNQFDSVMDYNFLYLCEAFFAKGIMDASTFVKRMASLRMRYKQPIQNALLTFLDTHDVKRFLYACGEDVKKLKLAFLYQMCYPGLPSVFYGDEIGLTGLMESEYRRKMEWRLNQDQEDLFSYYQKIIGIRKDTPALKTGDFIDILSDDVTNVIVFVRKLKEQKILVALNNSDKEQVVHIPYRFNNAKSIKKLLDSDVHTHNDNELVIKLASYSGEIIEYLL